MRALALCTALEPLVQAGRVEAHGAGAALQPRQLRVGGRDDAVADEARLHALELLQEGLGFGGLGGFGRFWYFGFWVWVLGLGGIGVWGLKVRHPGSCVLVDVPT